MGNVLQSGGSGAGQGVGTVIGSVVGGIWTFVVTTIATAFGLDPVQTDLWLKILIILVVCLFIYRLLF